MSIDVQRAAKLATRIAFFVAGFGIACWAPLVPFAKQRLDRLGFGDIARASTGRMGIHIVNHIG